MAVIMDGKTLAEKIRKDVAARVTALKRERGVDPGLAVILAGENPASRIYVTRKKKACHEAGIHSLEYQFGPQATQEELVSLIHELNQDPRFHGILVQLPLPQGIDRLEVIKAVSPLKDVDGFHPENMGLLFAGRPRFGPCTPCGIMKLLDHYGIPVEGKLAVVIGRSEIVGKPMAAMLLNRHATVVVCHSRTADLARISLQADIVIVAVGRPEFVTGDMIKTGATVIDVGINRLPERGLVGDVEFKSAVERAGAITPVPGGVGPMTIAMLLSNTVDAAHLQTRGGGKE